MGVGVGGEPGAPAGQQKSVEVQTPPEATEEKGKFPQSPSSSSENQSGGHSKHAA